MGKTIKKFVVLRIYLLRGAVGCLLVYARDAKILTHSKQLVSVIIKSGPARLQNSVTGSPRKYTIFHGLTKFGTRACYPFFNLTKLVYKTR